MSWYDYQRGRADATPINADAAALVGRIFLPIFLVFLAVAIPVVILILVVVNIQDSIHDDAVAAKAAEAKAALVARQKKLIENRKPFTFDGYTLYSGPANAKYLSFSITNSQGQVIYRQPAWMNDKVVSESKPMADIANHTYLHPGQIHFAIFGNGKGPRDRTYMQFISIDRADKVTWASPYSEPRKPQYAFNPNASVYMPPPLKYHKHQPVHWDSAFVMKILDHCITKYL